MTALGTRSPVPFCQLHGLVGLWDMLPLVADEFYRITTELRNVRTALASPPTDESVYDAAHIGICESVHNLLVALKPHLEVLGAKVASLALEEHAQFLIGSTLSTREGLVLALDDIDAQLTRELKSVKALVLSPAEQRLYEPKEPLFGAEVDSKFKRKARREINEAGKCLALQCYTACVFHLMRSVEVAIEAMRLCLGLQPPTKGQHKAWGAAIDKLREEIGKRDNLTYERQWLSMDDRKFFEEVCLSLVAIKDGCRDNTMHVESEYNKQEAEHLFAMVKGFMQKIASRFDEDGLPLAW